MGYTMELMHNGKNYSGGKLYGYADDNKLKSIKYLLKLGKLDNYDDVFYWHYCFFDREVTLSAKEFKKFFRKYKKDKKKYYWTEQSGELLQEINEIINDGKDKKIEWL